VALIALVLLLRDDGRSSGRAQPEPRAIEAEATRPPRELVEARASDAATAASAPAGGEPRRAAVEETPAAPSAAGWTVRVVRDGEPVADAEVTWLARGEMRSDMSGADAFERYWSASAALRPVARTSPQGETRVPPLATDSVVVARAGKSIGMRVIREPISATLEIRLQDDRDLEVRVTHASGAPADEVEVVVRLTIGHSEHRTRQTTDAAGLARFRRLGFGRDLDDTTTGAASVEGFFEPVLEAPFAVRAWPERPVELVLPPHGSLRIDVADARGEPVASSARPVELTLQREALPGAALYERERLHGTLEDGSVTFALIGLGLELEVAFDDRPRHAPARLGVSGPRRAGEQVVVRMELAGHAAELRVRVLAPEGEPLRESDLDLTHTVRMNGGMISDGDSARTDADGRLRLALEEEWSAGKAITLELAGVPSRGSMLKLDAGA
jgi:hypothetical protein